MMTADVAELLLHLPLEPHMRPALWCNLRVERLRGGNVGSVGRDAAEKAVGKCMDILFQGSGWKSRPWKSGDVA